MGASTGPQAPGGRSLKHRGAAELSCFRWGPRRAPKPPAATPSLRFGVADHLFDVFEEGAVAEGLVEDVDDGRAEAFHLFDVVAGGKNHRRCGPTGAIAQVGEEL